MLQIYASNRLEKLAEQLEHLIQSHKKSPLDPEIILVNNQGMARWLNLRLAQTQGISMNIRFELPWSFFWFLIQGENRQLPLYHPEVLSWRIYQILPEEEETHPYWLDSPYPEQRRFQLARHLAYLMTDYWIYRHDWVQAWQSDPPHWQARIWQRLVREQKLHPLKMMQAYLHALLYDPSSLPEQIYLFGINHLPPIWLDFLSELSQYIDIYLFHLNPCMDYWGDLNPERLYLKQWLLADEEQELALNPLLANLGRQGKDFFNLLLELPPEQDNTSLVYEPEVKTVLQHVQYDILSLHDARKAPLQLKDDSLVFVSAHSPLREVQGLRDWLLHQFNQDPELSLNDVLVMCPDIERYATLVEAVFNKPLECSVADRQLQEQKPLIRAFLDLLALPDSRFQVSKIIAFLHQPAVQKRFDLHENDIEIISTWLRSVHTYWGLDQAHKSTVLEQEADNDLYTWQQGLERLLFGFICGPQQNIIAGRLLQPTVESQQLPLLGRLLELIGLLKHYTHLMQQNRSALAWRDLILQMQQDLFQTESEDEGAYFLETALEKWLECVHLAQFDQELPLTVVRDYFQTHFQEEKYQQDYLIGKITFCSMVPMRSIPFKIIAVLGLNDGDFPRYPKQHFSALDLIEQDRRRRGDRSHLDEERYLFLEIIMSARQKLYLSYQGNSIKDNSEQQPSLVLKMLMDYVEKGYGWSLLSEAATDLHRLPMQPFSLNNYRPGQPFHSFDEDWLKLALKQPVSMPKLQLELDTITEVDLQQLIDFFAHPIKFFLQKRLGLLLRDHDDLLRDDEPFELDQLVSYQIKEALLDCYQKEQDCQNIIDKFKLSGALPDNKNIYQRIEQYPDEIQSFLQAWQNKRHGALQKEAVICQINQLELKAHLQRDEAGQLFLMRPTRIKNKDRVALWLSHLMAQIIWGATPSWGIYLKDNQPQIYRIEPIEADKSLFYLQEWLQFWQRGLIEPLLCPADLIQCYSQGDFNPRSWQQLWQGHPGKDRPYLQDPYYRLLYKEAPELDADWISSMKTLFLPLINSIQKDEAAI